MAASAVGGAGELVGRGLLRFPDDARDDQVSGEIDTRLLEQAYSSVVGGKGRLHVGDAEPVDPSVIVDGRLGEETEGHAGILSRHPRVEMGLEEKALAPPAALLASDDVVSARLDLLEFDVHAEFAEALCDVVRDLAFLTRGAGNLNEITRHLYHLITYGTGQCPVEITQ
jgi:hypothetical protein